jgi:hypothetical protein
MGKPGRSFRLAAQQRQALKELYRSLVLFLERHWRELRAPNPWFLLRDV